MLKKQYLIQIRRNKFLMFALMNHFDISISSLYRWLDENALAFTQYNCLVLIASFLNVENVNEMVESEKDFTNEYVNPGVRCKHN
jgi:hypothetical protein